MRRNRSILPAAAANGKECWGNRSLVSKERFPQVRNLNSRNSPSWGDCSFSVDLTSDRISATGGCPRFVPLRERRKKHIFRQGIRSFGIIVFLLSWKGVWGEPFFGIQRMVPPRKLPGNKPKEIKSIYWKSIVDKTSRMLYTGTGSKKRTERQRSMIREEGIQCSMYPLVSMVLTFRAWALAVCACPQKRTASGP